MSKPIYKAQEKPYQNDINDMIEQDEIEKGRGPDKKKRKTRGSNRSSDDPKIVEHNMKYRSKNTVVMYRPNEGQVEYHTPKGKK